MAASISGGSAVPLRLDGQFAGGPGEAFRYLVVFAELAVQGFEFFHGFRIFRFVDDVVHLGRVLLVVKSIHSSLVQI